MNARITVLLISISVLSSCQSETISDATEQEPDTTLPFVSSDQFPTLEGYIRRYELSPGVWREERGSRICDGYMTRYENEDYCASQIPDDWVPFQFNGRKYYVQPLAGKPDPP